MIINVTYQYLKTFYRPISVEQQYLKALTVSKQQSVKLGSI